VVCHNNSWKRIPQLPGKKRDFIKKGLNNLSIGAISKWRGKRISVSVGKKGGVPDSSARETAFEKILKKELPAHNKEISDGGLLEFMKTGRLTGKGRHFL